MAATKTKLKKKYCSSYGITEMTLQWHDEDEILKFTLGKYYGVRLENLRFLLPSLHDLHSWRAGKVVWDYILNFDLNNSVYFKKDLAEDRKGAFLWVGSLTTVLCVYWSNPF